MFLRRRAGYAAATQLAWQIGFCMGRCILDDEYTQINRGMDFATEGFTMPF